MTKTLKEIASRLKQKGMRCNCDLDNCMPQIDTGHSRVCRIHISARAIYSVRKKPKKRPNRASVALAAIGTHSTRRITR